MPNYTRARSRSRSPRDKKSHHHSDKDQKKHKKHSRSKERTNGDKGKEQVHKPNSQLEGAYAESSRRREERKLDSRFD